MARERHVIQAVWDTREQNRITLPSRWKGSMYVWDITMERMMLPTADYSARGHTGVGDDCKGIIFERKGSLDELANNFAGDRLRFKREIERMLPFACKGIFVEDATWDMIANHQYIGQIHPNAFIASLKAREEQGIFVRLCPDRESLQNEMAEVMVRYMERLERKRIEEGKTFEGEGI